MASSSLKLFLATQTKRTRKLEKNITKHKAVISDRGL